MGNYLFIVLYAPSWSLLPFGDYCSPSVLISLQIWVHARGSESLHGETGSHATLSECFSSKKTSFDDHHPLLYLSYQLYEALVIHNIHWILLILKPQIPGLFHQFIQFWKKSHNTTPGNLIFKDLIVSIKNLWIVDILSWLKQIIPFRMWDFKRFIVFLMNQLELLQEICLLKKWQKWRILTCSLICPA